MQQAVRMNRGGLSEGVTGTAECRKAPGCEEVPSSLPPARLRWDHRAVNHGGGEGSGVIVLLLSIWRWPVLVPPGGRLNAAFSQVAFA